MDCTRNVRRRRRRMSAALKRGTSLHKVSRFSRGLRAKKAFRSVAGKRYDSWRTEGGGKSKADPFSPLLILLPSLREGGIEKKKRKHRCWIALRGAIKLPQLFDVTNPLSTSKYNRSTASHLVPILSLRRHSSFGNCEGFFINFL